MTKTTKKALELEIEGRTEFVEKIERPLAELSDSEVTALRWTGAVPKGEMLGGLLASYEAKAIEIKAAGRDPFSVQDADSMLQSIRLIRRYMKTGDMEMVGVESMRLTFYALRVTVRPYDELAGTGRRVREGGKKGRGNMEWHRESINEKHQQWAEMAEQLGAQQHGTKSDIARWVARKVGEKPETVRKALRRLEKK